MQVKYSLQRTRKYCTSYILWKKKTSKVVSSESQALHKEHTEIIARRAILEIEVHRYFAVFWVLIVRRASDSYRRQGSVLDDARKAGNQTRSEYQASL